MLAISSFSCPWLASDVDSRVIAVTFSKSVVALTSLLVSVVVDSGMGSFVSSKVAGSIVKGAWVDSTLAVVAGAVIGLELVVAMDVINTGLVVDTDESPVD